MGYIVSVMMSIRTLFSTAKLTVARLLFVFFMALFQALSFLFFGYGGQRTVAAPAGQGGQQFAAHGCRAGGRM